MQDWFKNYSDIKWGLQRGGFCKGVKLALGGSVTNEATSSISQLLPPRFGKRSSPTMNSADRVGEKVTIEKIGIVSCHNVCRFSIKDSKVLFLI